MGQLKRPTAPATAEVIHFDLRIQNMDYSGPDIYVHALSGQKPGNLIVLAWRAAADRIETETPAFATIGTVYQCADTVERWLENEGWLKKGRTR
ncbi:MAG TPA: hypothetical protein VKI41_10965 [Vicinamibacteria bacterium]|nr:hypothetical protein [Vicinamibacteria bacterium]